MQIIWLHPGNLSWIIQIRNISGRKYLDHRVGIDHTWYISSVRGVQCSGPKLPPLLPRLHGSTTVGPPQSLVRDVSWIIGGSALWCELLQVPSLPPRATGETAYLSGVSWQARCVAQRSSFMLSAKVLNNTGFDPWRCPRCIYGPGVHTTGGASTATASA